MNLFLALLVGVLAFFVSRLLFNEIVSALIAIVIAVVIAMPTIRRYRGI